MMGERRELNPRMVDSQSTALSHLATSAPTLYIKDSISTIHDYCIESFLLSEIQILNIKCQSCNCTQK